MYLVWHYSRAISNLTKIWLNLLWFIFHFFSIGLLTRTLFSPWRRLNESYRGGIEIWSWVETLIVNGLMRIVGVLVRLAVIFTGLVCLIVMTLAYPVMLLIWLALPPIVIGLFLAGLLLIFS